jgi:PAS domain S-box-containing protein
MAFWERRDIVKINKQLEQEIAERKSTEKALRESEAQLRFLADNISDVIWTMDMEQRFTYASRSIQKFLGYTQEEALQVYLKQILTSESYEKSVQVMTKAFLEKREVSGAADISLTLELEHIRKDGGTIWAEMTTSFTRDEKGLISGFIGVSRDITKRKQANEQRDKLIYDLQKALDKVKLLSGLLPICSYCKNIRNDKGYWEQIESYIYKYTDTELSHGICPECAKKLYHDMDLYGEDETLK